MYLKKATRLLQRKLQEQENVQDAHWKLAKHAYHGDKVAAEGAWKARKSPKQPACEKRVHNALVKRCRGWADMTTSYALQFHQVVVNLCADRDLTWGKNPALGEAVAAHACPGAVVV